ncbi:carbohydrate porin, partial [Yersinia rohdei]|uniref:carbohydrate porin n=1 Tax=Yersinia rohdei TaxID=29485 RepID=UPI001E443761
ISVFAQGKTQTTQELITPEQLNKIVAQAVEKALAERQDKIDAALVKKKNVDIVDTSAIKPSPETEIPYGLKFNAYARYGAHYQAGDQKYIGVDGSYNGSSAIGRLGNEGNGGEFQLSKAFKGNNGALWDVVVMLDHWGDEVNLKKAYAGVTNLFESQPNAYLWAGRDFHQRPQQGINDYFWMTHDGQGAGIKDLDLGVLKLDAATVASVSSCNPQVVADQTNPSRITCTGGSGTGDSGHYALTSKIHGVKMGPIDFELYTNYGFDSKAIESDEKLKAWQTAVVLSHKDENSENKWVTRYSDNSDNSVYNKTSDLRTVYTSLEGTYKFTPLTSVTYLAAFHDYDRSNHTEDNRRNYGLIIRPMHFWNSVHSTWLEAGYQRVDYDTGGDNKGWKLTLSQNISIDMGAEFRPMLRFYVTGGEVDNKHTATTTDTENTRLDSFNIGAMWEAWF